MTMKLTPKDWDSFQHYKDRAPAWIKLHRKLLDNYEFACLPDASRALAPMLWLLASEFDDGKITAELDAVAFRLRMNVDKLRADLQPLLDKKFFVLEGAGSVVQAPRTPAAIPEREEEKEEQEQKETEVERPAAPAAHEKSSTRSKQTKLQLGDKPQTRGSRMTADWKPSTKNADDARAEGLSEVLFAKEAKKFRDYWLAVAGQKGVKIDWDATWRNWCRSTAERLGLKSTDQKPDQQIEPRSLAEWQKILRIYASTHNWISSWGPAPGKPGCLVPPDLLKDEGDIS